MTTDLGGAPMRSLSLVAATSRRKNVGLQRDKGTHYYFRVRGVRYRGSVDREFEMLSRVFNVTLVLAYSSKPRFRSLILSLLLFDQPTR
jgi:hypothetical protein